MKKIAKKIGKMALTCAIFTGGMILSAGCDKTPQFEIEWKEELLGTLSIQPGESFVLYASRDDKSSGTISYVLTKGSEYATINSNGVLTVLKTAPVGEIIKVQAVSGKVKSEEIQFTIVAAREIILSSNASSTTVEREDEITLNTNYLDDNTSVAENITYRLTAGSEYATITGNVLKVKSTATQGATITVIAETATATSNTLTFTVSVPKEEVKYLIVPSSSQITLDTTLYSPNTAIVVTTYDKENFGEVSLEKDDYIYEVVDGEEFASINENGVIEPLGHGRAVIQIKYISGEEYVKDATTTVTVDVIMPPETIELNSVLTRQMSKEVYKLGFGLKNSDDRGLDLGIIGKHTRTTKMSDTYKVNIYVDGSTTPSNGYASYNSSTGKLEFNTVAIGHELRVEVLSDSGAQNETKTEFIININNGVNYYTPEDIAKQRVATNLTINLMNDIIIEGDSDKLAGLPGENGLKAYKLHLYGNSTIYGNGNKIDFSKVVNKYSGGGREENFITITNTNFNDLSNVIDGDIEANIYDLSIYGNNEYNNEYPDHNTPTSGTFASAIDIEGANLDRIWEYLKDNTKERPYHAYVDMKNITINGFQIGINLEYVISKEATDYEEAKISKLSNIVIENCLQNGIATTASILTIEDVKIGRVGATGIETTPGTWWLAGENFNKPQTITFKGSYVSENYNTFLNSYIEEEENTDELKFANLINVMVSDLNVAGYNFGSLIAANIKEDDVINNGVNLISLIYNDVNAITTSLSGKKGFEKGFMNGTIIKFQDMNGKAIDLMTKLYEIQTYIGSSNYESVRTTIIEMVKSRFIELDIPSGKPISLVLDYINTLDEETKNYLLTALAGKNEIEIGSIIVANPLYDLIDEEGNIMVDDVSKSVDELSLQDLTKVLDFATIDLDK